MTDQKLTKITFIGYAEKRFFIKQNAISASEIVEETPGSITLLEESNSTVNWANNGYVYSVEVLA